jgi:hypothetical protein
MVLLINCVFDSSQFFFHGNLSRPSKLTSFLVAAKFCEGKKKEESLVLLRRNSTKQKILIPELVEPSLCAGFESPFLLFVPLTHTLPTRNQRLGWRAEAKNEK